MILIGTICSGQWFEQPEPHIVLAYCLKSRRKKNSKIHQRQKCIDSKSFTFNKERAKKFNSIKDLISFANDSHAAS